jgi:ABC-type branched-subunit amino acid transport system ATPase component
LSTAAISLKNVSVTLGGNRILKDVSLDFESGRTSGLIGPNGAGKSTLLNYICRIIPAVSGSLSILGRDSGRLQPHQVLRAGLARTFQGSQFVSDLTALENVMLGYHVRIGQGFFAAALRLPSRRRTETVARNAALAAMERVGILELAGLQISEISFGNQRKIDLARALVADAPCILLDEPMAGLSAEEKDGLCAVLSGLRRQGGPTIVLVEHDMQVVSRLCEWTAVLDAGELIASGPTADVLRSERVADAYMGSQRLDA